MVKKVSEIFCFPGNAGTSLIAQNVNLDPDNFSELEKYCLKKDIKILVVGPEKPLIDGIYDFIKGYIITTFFFAFLLIIGISMWKDFVDVFYPYKDLFPGVILVLLFILISIEKISEL